MDDLEIEIDGQRLSLVCPRCGREKELPPDVTAKELIIGSINFKHGNH